MTRSTLQSHGCHEHARVCGRAAASPCMETSPCSMRQCARGLSECAESCAAQRDHRWLSPALTPASRSWLQPAVPSEQHPGCALPSCFEQAQDMLSALWITSAIRYWWFPRVAGSCSYSSCSWANSSAAIAAAASARLALTSSSLGAGSLLAGHGLGRASVSASGSGGGGNGGESGGCGCGCGGGGGRGGTRSGVEAGSATGSSACCCCCCCPRT